MKNATNIAAMAAVILALVAMIGLLIPMYSRLGQMEVEIRHLADEIRRLDERADERHQEILEEFRRFSEALNSHSHTPDGDVIFTVPPPRASGEPEHSRPDQAAIPTPTPTPTSTPAQPAAPR